MITVIVVDDENIARRRLVRLLEETGEAKVVAECAGGRDAVGRIATLEPQMVFLDVQMPDLDGFGVLQALDGNALPAIIFVTAFDQYAVRAFDVHAVDYLLKPYDTARFREAFERAKEHIETRARADEDGRLRALLRDYLSDDARASGGRDYLDRVAVKVDGVLRIVRTTDIDWWETDGNYVRLHVGAANHLIRATAASIESQLDPKQFLRIHRRYIVNIDRVVEVQPWFGGDSIVLLKGGAKLRLSRTYRERLHSRLLGVRGEAVEAPVR
jgi:two-component system LytT family response regulator